MSTTTSQIEATLRRDVAKAEVACQQIRILNHWIEELEARYERADRMGCAADRYSIEMELSIAQGVRCVFWEYGRRMMHKVLVGEELLDQSEQGEEMQG